jgi:hypothetical protein
VGVFGSYDDEPDGRSLISDFRNLLHHHVHHAAHGPASTFWAGLGAIRRDVFLTASGFDESKFAESSIEDIDLGMRLVAGGSRIVLDSGIQGKHLKVWTLRAMITTDLLRRGSPWVRLLLEQGSDSKALNLGWRHRLSAVASLACVGALLGRKHRVAAISLSVLISLNADFYLLLYRQRGMRQVFAGVPLHVLHHLLGVLAVPLGTYQHFRAEDKNAKRR